MYSNAHPFTEQKTTLVSRTLFNSLEYTLLTYTSDAILETIQRRFEARRCGMTSHTLATLWAAHSKPCDARPISAVHCELSYRAEHPIFLCFGMLCAVSQKRTHGATPMRVISVQYLYVILKHENLLNKSHYSLDND